MMSLGAELRIFIWGPSCSTNIFIKTTPTHTHIQTLFYYIHTQNIYTHTLNKKESLFSIKIVFDGNLS